MAADHRELSRNDLLHQILMQFRHSLAQGPHQRVKALPDISAWNPGRFDLRCAWSRATGQHFAARPRQGEQRSAGEQYGSQQMSLRVPPTFHGSSLR
jgi:hypothetical protein